MHYTRALKKDHLTALVAKAPNISLLRPLSQPSRVTPAAAPNLPRRAATTGRAALATATTSPGSDERGSRDRDVNTHGVRTQSFHTRGLLPRSYLFGSGARGGFLPQLSKREMHTTPKWKAKRSRLKF